MENYFYGLGEIRALLLEIKGAHYPCWSHINSCILLALQSTNIMNFMRQSRKFCQRGPNLITFFYLFFYSFLVDWGIEDPNTTINEPPSARQRNVIKLAFRWLADVGRTLNAGSIALCFSRRSGQVLERNPIFSCFF